MKHHADLSQIPPNNGLVFPPKSHHSWADWDKENNRVSLQPDQFISPPTSIKRSATTSPYGTSVLCRAPVTQDLVTGQIETYYRRSDGSFGRIQFRSQTPLGTANPDDSYYVDLKEGWAQLIESFPGGIGGVGFFTDAGSADDVWYLLKLSWWEGIGLECVKALLVNLQRYEAGAWIDKGTVEAPHNIGAETGIARVGINFYKGDTWFDNTIIRGPA